MTKSRIKFWLVYLFTTSIICFLALEGLIRLLQIAPTLPTSVLVPDPYLPYKPQPNSIATSHTNEFSCEYRHNSLGFRDVEHSLNKPNGVFRILALGDSFTYGAGVSFEETYLHRLEEMLNNRSGPHPKVEIIKGGVSRYFPEPERILLERYGVNYSPDLIIVGFVPNDVEDTRQGIDAVKLSQSGYLVERGSDRMAGIISSLYTYSHACRIVLAKYKTFRANKEPQVPLDEIYQPGGFYETAWKQVELEYEKIVITAKSINAAVVFVHIPHQGPWDHSRAYPAMRLSQWASKHSAVLIDTLPAMSETSTAKNLYYEKDGHCRPAGYEVIAETLFQELTKRKLVP